MGIDAAGKRFCGAWHEPSSSATADLAFTKRAKACRMSGKGETACKKRKERTVMNAKIWFLHGR